MEFLTVAENTFFNYCSLQEFRDKTLSVDDFKILLTNRQTQLTELQNALITEITHNLLTTPYRQAYLKRLLEQAEKHQAICNEAATLLLNNSEEIKVLVAEKHYLGNNYYAEYFLTTASVISKLVFRLKSYLQIETQLPEEDKEFSENTPSESDSKNPLITSGFNVPKKHSELTVAQIAILVSLLEEHGVLFTSHLGARKASNILEVLTQYSSNTLRINLNPTSIERLKKQSQNGEQGEFGNVKKIKQVLLSMIQKLDKEEGKL